MVLIRILNIRWLWRHRIFFSVAAITLVCIQMLVGFMFFNLYDDKMKMNYNTSIFQIEKPVYSNFNKIDFSNNVDCNVSTREALSAINRAKTLNCKQHISNIACRLSNNTLYPDYLPHSCPNEGLKYGKYLGCYRDSHSSRLLSASYHNSSKYNSPKFCINRCLRSGFPFAGVQHRYNRNLFKKFWLFFRMRPTFILPYLIVSNKLWWIVLELTVDRGEECFCGIIKPSKSFKLPESQCSFQCPHDSSQFCGGFNAMNVYETGVSRFKANLPEISKSHENSNNSTVRIVFLLTLNGRSVRQVNRLIKLLYHEKHYFFIHIDSTQDYLFRELLPLENKLPNVILSRNRYHTIWGGASLLTMLLESMAKLIQLPWDWDFVINLSESDFPIKTNDQLVSFLSANKDRNFVKSHGRDVHHFINKQGLDKTFVECDDRMWKIGNKPLPSGIVIDGGSDWVALSRKFVSFLVTQTDNDLLNGLRVIFEHTLLPAEVSN